MLTILGVICIPRGMDTNIRLYSTVRAHTQSTTNGWAVNARYGLVTVTRKIQVSSKVHIVAKRSFVVRHLLSSGNLKLEKPELTMFTKEPFH
jgi:hypothetical protein